MLVRNRANIKSSLRRVHLLPERPCPSRLRCLPQQWMKTPLLLKRKGDGQVERDLLCIVICEGACWEREDSPRSTSVLHSTPTRPMPSRLSPKPTWSRVELVKKYVFDGFISDYWRGYLLLSTLVPLLMIFCFFFSCKRKLRFIEPSSTGMCVSTNTSLRIARTVISCWSYVTIKV